jgi:plasmid replication initiation protein
VAEKVIGGIKENQALEKFQARSADASLKDQIDLMSRCWFSLTAKRTDPIEHEYRDSRSNRVEKVKISGTQEFGIATIHDQDVLMFVISQWIDSKRQGQPVSRRVCFTPYQFFAWINREPTGSAYQRLQDALHRLRMTSIETTVDYVSGKRFHRKKQFSWISEWAISEVDGRIKGIEVVIAEWLFESIQDFNVLTLDKRYFDIVGAVERWLYLYARKATGSPTGMWKESFARLYEKSASQQAFKHYASALRKLVLRNNLPGLTLAIERTASGKEMLVMQRTEPTVRVEDRRGEQLVLIEQTPLEEAWENVLAILRKQLSPETVSAWFEKLILLGLDGDTLSFRAPSRFSAERIESLYRPRLIAAWESLGHAVADVRFEEKAASSAA